MAVGSCVFSSDDIVVKSLNDRRLYRYIQLHNGLCALLVHDPDVYPGETKDDDDDDKAEEEEDGNEIGGVEQKLKGKGGASQTKQTAAAMCVGMGSFSDPFEAQGLAHFLEHMLFMGSADFPDENEYDSYMSKSGGSSNAYTEAEHTCYHFAVKREFLKGALTRRIVEFNLALQRDSCRLQQLQCNTSAPGHCFNRFSWGNKKSLVDAMEKGVDLREQVLKFYSENYHAGIMKLVVIGGETLDILESWVLELFGNIKKGPPRKQGVRMAIPVWETGKLYRLEAVRDVHRLELSWTLPCLCNDYLKTPEGYLSHLIGHEGKGSLDFFLKAKGWATSSQAGVGGDGMDRSSIAYIFRMTIHLTDSGLQKIFDIIGYVYQYIKLLHQVSPQEWIFKELQNIANIEFRFAEEQPQDDYAVELSENLLLYPPEHVIYGQYAHEVWDEDMIKYVLSFFTPENMRADVVSKSINNSQDIQIEPWFGSSYTVEDISPSLRELWRDPPKIDELLHLPAKNEFIPCDFSIHAVNSSSFPAVFPKRILDEPLMQLWYKLDRTFKFPRANAYFRITMKGGYTTLKNSLLTELFVDLVKDELNEVTYQASVAKLETSVYVNTDKLELKICGFNDKLLILLTKVLETFKTFVPTEDRFKVIKEGMERRLRNTNMKPLSHSSYLRLQILFQIFWDVDEKLNLLNDLTLDDLKAFIPELLSQLYIEGLCHGNILEEDAIKISKIYQSNFPVQPLPADMRHLNYLVCLDSSADLVRDLRVKNKLETNSVVQGKYKSALQLMGHGFVRWKQPLEFREKKVAYIRPSEIPQCRSFKYSIYYQIEPEVLPEAIKLTALADLFDEIVVEPLYNQLRTKEQLGYSVGCSQQAICRILGYNFHVQSSTYNPIYLQGRIDNFINGLQEFLDALDKESLEGFKSGLVAKLLEKDPSLQYETDQYWKQITDRRYIFDFYKKEAEVVKKIEKGEVIEWYNTYLRKPSPKCRRLAVRVWGCNAGWTDSHTEATPVRVIDDPTAFKMSSKFYPRVRI